MVHAATDVAETGFRQPSPMRDMSPFYLLRSSAQNAAVRYMPNSVVSLNDESGRLFTTTRKSTGSRGLYKHVVSGCPTPALNFGIRRLHFSVWKTIIAASWRTRARRHPSSRLRTSEWTLIIRIFPLLPISSRLSSGALSLGQQRVEVAGNLEGLTTQADDEDEDFVYPAAEPEHPKEVPRQRHPPSPAQLESLFAAASSGDLPLLKRLFKNALEIGNVESFGLANDASSRTGTTALHAAASRGYLDIVVWRKRIINLC